MKKMMCTLMSVALLWMCFLSFPAASAESVLNVGDKVAFGSYPQGRVADETLIGVLNAQELNWISYGYLSGNGEPGSMVESDYMKYADVIYNGQKYRAVRFEKYRPSNTRYAFPTIEANGSAGYTNQFENKYYPNTVYWFKYEPILWRVLDAENGLLLSEKIIDSRSFSDYSWNEAKKSWFYEWYADAELTHYANDYSYSSIRAWLNSDADGFYNTAFSQAEKEMIQNTELETNVFKSQYYSEKYDSKKTNDNVFFLAYEDMVNKKYGFTPLKERDIGAGDEMPDPAGQAIGTDYAGSQGLYI